MSGRGFLDQLITHGHKRNTTLYNIRSWRKSWNKQNNAAVQELWSFFFISEDDVMLKSELDNIKNSAYLWLSSVKNFSPHHRVQTGSESHPASYPMFTRGSFPGGKAAGE